MKKITLALSAAALALVGSAAVYAATNDDDANQTRTEYVAKTNEMWAKLDVNKDGVVNEADRDAMKAQMFDRIDTNHDGSISRDEFMAAHPGGPGGEHGMGGPEGGAMGMREGGHHGGGRHGGHHGRMGMGMGMMLLHMADTNHDGNVTKAEFDAAAAQHFDMVDANHDGTITKAERQAARAAMRQRMGEMRGHGGGMGDMDGMDMPPPPPSGN